MAVLSIESTPTRSGFLRYSPFTLEMYFRDKREYLSTERFDTMILNGNAETTYDARKGFERDTALCARSCRWSHRGGLGAALLNNHIQYVNTSFVHGEEPYGYASRLTTVTG